MCVLVKSVSIQDDFYWEGYGLRLSVSGSLTETCKISVRALVGGKFKFPERMKLSSAVYAISISEPLLKPVKLEIQHYAHVVVQEHTRYLSFVAASLKQDGQHYNFEVKKGGQFFVRKQYGCISLSESTLIAVVTSDELLNEELVLESTADLSLDDYQDEEVCLDARKLEHFVRHFLHTKPESDHIYACNCILPVLARSIHSYNKFDPLVLLWPQPISQGFFLALISNLCSSAPKRFKVSRPQLGKIQSCKTAVSLKCVNVGGEVLLVETKFSIDIYYSGQPENCYSIREMIKNEVHAVITSTEKFRDMVCFAERLHCHVCDAKEHVKHFCFLEGDKYLRCCNTMYQINSERQLPWFQSESEGKSVCLFMNNVAACLASVLIQSEI